MAKKKSHSNGRGESQRQQRTQPPPRGGIFDVLRRDHARVVQLLDDLEETSDDATATREDLFRRLRDELDFHSRAEEAVVYSQFQRIGPTRQRVLDSIEEHHVVTVMLGELDAMAKDHERWLAKLRVLGDAVRRHVEQEEQELFLQMAQMLDAEQTREAGSEFSRQKQAWQELARRSPGAAAMIRGVTQIAERVPYGPDMIASTVQSHPEMITRLVARLQRWLPDRRRGVFGFLYQTATLPVRLPLALIGAR
jgi:hypothetical protein